MLTLPLLRYLCFTLIGVQATVLTENLALNKESYLSDTDGDHAAHLANDGSLANGMCAKTLSKNGHWEVDLGNIFLIGQIKVYNTDESCCSADLQSVSLFTSEIKDTYVFQFTTAGPALSVYTWTFADIVYARWIKITRKRGQKNPMTICEVEVFERLLEPNTGIPAATTGLIITGNPGTPTTTIGSVTPGNPDNLTNIIASASTSNPLKTQLFSLNNQKRAAGEVIHTYMSRSERHCCFVCLVTMTTNECKSVNYNKVTGECSLVKDVTTEDDADDNTAMLIPNAS